MSSDDKVADDKQIWYVDTPEVEFRYDFDSMEVLSNHEDIYVNDWGAPRGGGVKYMLHIGDKRIGFQDVVQGGKSLNYRKGEDAVVIVFELICVPIIADIDQPLRMFGDRYKNIGEPVDHKRRLYTNVHKFGSVDEQNYILSLFAKAIIADREARSRNREIKKLFDYSDKVSQEIKSGKYLK